MSDELTPLSEREMEILRLVATGATNQQIAQDLVISINTVKVHLRNIYAKLEVASRTEATMFAVGQGWVDVPRTTAEPEEVAEAPENGVEAPDTMPAAGTPSGVLPRERWPRVSLAKRISLVVAMLVALAALFLPLLLPGEANNGASDPISNVFPTVPAGPATTRWRTRAQMPTPRSNLAMVAHDGLIFAIGGVSNDGVTGKVEVYDPQADTWTAASAKPTPVGFVSAVVVGGKIYVPGGIDAEQHTQQVLEVYDPALDAWEVHADMPEPLAAYGLAALEDRIYVFGGLDGQGYVDSVFHYDAAADRWTEMRPMATARGFLSAATVEERIYVVGGYDDVTEFNSCDLYDPATDSWTSLAPMDLERGGLVAVPVRGQLYAIGGGMTAYLAFNERYDPRVDAWSRIETPVKEQWQGLGGTFVSPYLYAIGGWNDGNLSVNEAYRALFQSLVPIAP